MLSTDRATAPRVSTWSIVISGGNQRSAGHVGESGARLVGRVAEALREDRGTERYRGVALKSPPTITVAPQVHEHRRIVAHVACQRGNWRLRVRAVDVQRCKRDRFPAGRPVR